VASSSIVRALSPKAITVIGHEIFNLNYDRATTEAISRYNNMDLNMLCERSRAPTAYA